MEANQEEARREEGRERGPDVKHQVAAALIAAMEQSNTPWQKPWSASSMRPINGATLNAYRATNRILLALQGRADPRWLTYRQAAEKGWQVRGGERGTMIVKLVELGPGERSDEAERQEAAGESGTTDRKRMVLRRYFVFNAEQIDGVPPMEPEEQAREFEPAERAEKVLQALREKTGLVIAYGGAQAFYDPKADKIQLPQRKKFRSAYDLAATQFHEAGHSTLAKHRLDRRDALGERWGDEAYAMEELRAEICSAILAAETGVPMCQDPKHVANHAAYLRSWVSGARKDPLAIFAAARDAERMAEYLLGMERQLVAMAEHKEWVDEYERAPAR
ncbi:MAG: zincin-like metallopeptidase domain-containing protein [Pseudomonadota bacterium]